jgi:hypothetical protein
VGRGQRKVERREWAAPDPPADGAQQVAAASGSCAPPRLGCEARACAPGARVRTRGRRGLAPGGARPAVCVPRRRRPLTWRKACRGCPACLHPAVSGVRF